MAEFKNRFQWSISRRRNFDTCKRLYYYRHYGMWNGWKGNAPEEARKCYRFSKMQNLPLLAGTIVHQLIEQLLKGMQRGRLQSLEELQERGRVMLNQAWRQSKEKKWLRDPKRNANLFEHYYDREVAEVDTQEIRARVLDSLAHFYNSSTFARIRQTAPADWRSIEEFQSFDIEGCANGLSMDFAVHANGILEIYDWKTGREAESHIDQLVCYALYGEQEWGYSLDCIRLYLFYLGDNSASLPYTVSPAEKDETIARILHNCELMRSLLVDPVNNLARKEDFVMTDDRSRCEHCFFQELCFGPGSL